MAIKKFKPTTPSRRQMTTIVNSELSENSKGLRSALAPRKRKAGRNNRGKITVRHRGGGAKKLYRIIDFKRNKVDIPGKIQGLFYDPNRTCNIALVAYKDGYKNYILAPAGLGVGDLIISSDNADIKVGNSKMMKNIPDGTVIHNVELKPGAGGQIARSAGSFVQLMAKEKDYVLLRMPSGEIRKVKNNCRATVGQVGNAEHEQTVIGKAGRKRHMGIRPTVRGVAMNPVDHPLGGGEGRSSGGRHPCTPWGKPTKGYRTRNCKRTDSFIVKRRKKK